jgi:uncharacterized membrane protein YidH (DUF202 family)
MNMSRQAGSTFVLSRRRAPEADHSDDLRIEVHETEDTELPLWTRRDLIVLAVGLGIALVVIALSWYGSSGTRQPSRQVRWVAVSIIGLTLSAVTNAVWLLRSRRAIGRGLRSLPATLGWVGQPTATVARPGREEIFVASGSSTLYHRPACVFAEGRADRSGPRDQHQRAGLSPCEVCEP